MPLFFNRSCPWRAWKVWFQHLHEGNLQREHCPVVVYTCTYWYDPRLSQSFRQFRLSKNCTEFTSTSDGILLLVHDRESNEKCIIFCIWVPIKGFQSPLHISFSMSFFCKTWPKMFEEFASRTFFWSRTEFRKRCHCAVHTWCSISMWFTLYCMRPTQVKSLLCDFSHFT